MKNNVLFKTRFKKIIDAFWLREDILEIIPNCQCEYLDNNFRLLCVSSETLFSENELKPVFELYKTEFFIVEQNISRARLHTIS
ncbi:hypothetical protein SAMN05421856_101163 [Chryseobacterium taichungense]|uniref:Uncharacterized protein n=1 Tax=Chryseobacterium taichungense TaxID=295069 RepID=A0A1H7VQ48_9FLAO|nr:hypothetical protein [Chryseobacterium taichungense]SEM11300.1 hypothetical protein SAMN05421856_101163 [Chryseobacterium taichungense]